MQLSKSFAASLLQVPLLSASLQNGRALGLDIRSDLGPHLSPGASIFLPGSKKFDSATTRWQTYREPNITMVVEVATEKDVRSTIKYANDNDIPFLAVNGGHGAINSLGKLHHGIQIWMRKLNKIEIAEDGKSAMIGGGVLSKQAVDTLFASNKETVIGCCECTSMMGPMLGGGHGWLQGRYGLSADNLLEARMVFANGSAATVSSTSHPDLFWAIRGAGHNFGVVTEFKFKIHDVPPNDMWTFESLVFKGDNVEQLYTEANKLTEEAKKRAGLINFSYFLRIPDIDPDNAVINFFIMHQGPKEEEKKYTKPFHDIGPLSVTVKEVTYPELSSLTGNGINDIACQPLGTALRFPISLKSYNVSAQRIVYDMFNTVTRMHPALSGSLFLLEGYSVGAVQAVPHDSTAFPDRENNLLLSPAFFYETNKTLDPIAIQAGNDMRKVLLESSGSKKLHAYVNYAHGDETMQDMYGHEPWRLEKLKMLKQKHDPKGRFSFYAPIA